MEQDTERVERTYDTVAERYAGHFSGEHEQKPKDREMLERFAREAGNRSPVWDLGCGPGHTASYLRDLGVNISGLDLSEKLLEQARKRYPDIAFRKGSLLDLDFESDSVAAAVSFYAIVHFTEGQAETAFCEIFRVLAPGGLLLMTYHIGEETIRIREFLGKEVDIEFMFFTTAFIRSSLEKAGFTAIEITEREPYPDVEYQSRRAYVFARKPE